MYTAIVTDMEFSEASGGNFQMWFSQSDAQKKFYHRGDRVSLTQPLVKFHTLCPYCVPHACVRMQQWVLLLCFNSNIGTVGRWPWNEAVCGLVMKLYYTIVCCYSIGMSYKYYGNNYCSIALQAVSLELAHESIFDPSKECGYYYTTCINNSFDIARL